MFFKVFTGVFSTNLHRAVQWLLVFSLFWVIAKSGLMALWLCGLMALWNFISLLLLPICSITESPHWSAIPRKLLVD